MSLLIPFLAAVALVQQTAALSGTVRQDSTLVPLPDIRVEVAELGRAAVSDARGHFVITGIPNGRWTVRASGIGYRSLEREVVVADAISAAIELLLVHEPVPISGLNVEVLRIRSIGPPRIKIEMETLAEVPALAEVDVLRALDVLPAVATVSEYSTALYVRGGTPDQTDILLDGFPVFNPYHLGGLYAAFSPDAVASVEVTPGAMPAALGSRMSSVVRVSTREGGADRVRGRGTFSLASAGFALDGPAPTGALPGTFLMSARRSFRGLTGGGISGEGIVPGTYRTVFHDAFAKWTLPWSGGALQPIWFTTSERIRLPDEHTGARHDWQWGSTLLGLTSAFTLGQSARVEAKLASSTFHTRLGTWWTKFLRPLEQEETISADGDMADRLGSVELVHATPGKRFSVGAEVRRSTMSYRANRVDDPPGGMWSEFVPRFADTLGIDVLQIWAEGEVEVTRAIGVRLGVRALAAEGLDAVLQPRAGLRLDVAPWLALTAGAGAYAQPVHSIRVDEAIATSFMAFDLQRPASAAIGVPRATDVAVGAELRAGRASARVDAYRKWYDDLSLPALPPNPWHAEVIEPDAFLPGEGETRGVDVMVDYVTDPVGIWVAYGYLDVRRTVAGRTFTPRYERRHTIDGFTALSLPDGIRLNLRAVYGTGQPATPVVGMLPAPRFDVQGGGFAQNRAQRWVTLGEHNSIRLPRYLRVDFGGRIEFNREVLGVSTDLALFAQMLNVLNNLNTVYWDPSTSAGVGDDPTWQFAPQLTAGLEWAF